MPYKEGNGYRGVVKFNGQRCTAKRATKQAAKDWETEKRKLLRAIQNQTPTVSLLKASTAYLQYCEKLKYNPITVSNKKKALRELLAVTGGNMPIENVEPGTILEQVILKQKTGALSNERRKHLRSFFEYCKVFQGLRQNPVVAIPEVPQDPPRQPVPTHTEIEKMRVASTRQDRNMIVFASETGGRKEEILRLTFGEDIDLLNSRVRFGNRKNKKRVMRYRWVPLSKEALQVLEDQRKIHLPDSDYVFQQREKKQPNYGGRFTARRRFMRGISKKAKVREMGFHSLRRYYASKLVEQGMDLKQIQVLLGHGSIATTDKYIFLLKEDIRVLLEQDRGEEKPKGKVVKLAGKKTKVHIGDTWKKG